MSLGRDLDELLARMALLPEPPAMDYAAPVVTTSKAGSSAPPNFHPLAVEWSERVKRLLVAAERDLARAQARPTSADRRSDAKREADSRIVARVNEGRDPTYVAFLEGRTTEGVRKLRLRHGLDPDDGTRMAGALTSRRLPEGDE